MTRTRAVAVSILAVLVAVAAFLLLRNNGNEKTSPKGPSSLELTKRQQLDPRLTQLTFDTSALDSPTNVRVLLPDGYKSSGLRYPVLYLLHGAEADYTGWTTAGNAEALTNGLPLIVVMPDGGTGGFYSNWYNDGNGGPPEWETYHIHQLLPWIDSHYRTIADKGGRAIAGVSMGGFGAFSYAARHPGLFTAAASFSGSLNITYPPWIPIFEAQGASASGQPALWGSYAQHPDVWRAHNPVDLASKLRGTKLYMYTGNGQPGGKFGDPGDPVEPAIEQMNIAMNDKLKQLGIPHYFDDYGPGGHNILYAVDDFQRVLPSLMKDLSPPQK
jgi:S-formylglutathione hydrolase FrmB